MKSRGEKPKPKTRKIRVETKEEIKSKYERSPQALRSYGFTSPRKGRVKANNPYTTFVKGRAGVHPAIAELHDRSSRNKKKKSL